MLVSFHDLANLELREAAESYESESDGLGQAFITEVERCTDDIVRYPEAGLVMRGSIRRSAPGACLLFRQEVAGQLVGATGNIGNKVNREHG